MASINDAGPEAADDNRKRKFGDQGALNGLRGYAAVHVMLFHSLYSCTFHLNLHASVQMPLFFLLSGFCLTLNYGRKQYDGFDFCCGPCQVVDTLSHRFIYSGSCIEKSDDEEQPSSVFDSWRFYINRFSRILPVYWLCMFIALPLVFLGYGVFAPFSLKNLFGFIEAFFGLATMVVVHGFGPNNPGWTICTLSVFYWMFPNFLIRAQRWTNKKLAAMVVTLFWIQFALGLIIYHRVLPLHLLGIPPWVPYWIATANPLSRCPVFFMGVCAGLLALRKSNGQVLDQEKNGFFSINLSSSIVKMMYDKFPWVNVCNKNNAPDPETEEMSQQSWKTRVDLNMLSYNFFLILFTVLHGLYIHLFDYWKTSDGTDPKHLPFEVYALRGRFNSWLQFAFVHLQLMIMVGLCFDGGLSYTSRFLRSKVMQFLGRISMSLYLIHEPLLYYIACCLNGPLEYPDKDASIEAIKAYGQLKKIPPWTLPIFWILSIKAGALLTIFVEEPTKKLLRKFNKKPRSAPPYRNC